MDTPSANRIRPAATVILVRDGESGLEVFLLQRVAGMAFAGGMTAFPGGGVDPGDALLPPWSGPDAQWWAEHLAVEVDQACAVVVAAARELFEETGVLLAEIRPDDEQKLQDVAAHRLSLAQLLGDRPLRTELLRPWARWVTPAEQPRRYDTFFLVAALPAGQRAQLRTTEAVVGAWWQPEQALRTARAGELALLPPTAVMLLELTACADVAGVLGQDRRVVAMSPVVISASGEPLRVRAGDREIAAIGVLTP